MISKSIPHHNVDTLNSPYRAAMKPINTPANPPTIFTLICGAAFVEACVGALEVADPPAVLPVVLLLEAAELLSEVDAPEALPLEAVAVWTDTTPDVWRGPPGNVKLAELAEFIGPPGDAILVVNAVTVPSGSEVLAAEVESADEAPDEAEEEPETAEVCVAEAENAEHSPNPTDAAMMRSLWLQFARRHGVTAVWMAACAVPQAQAWSVALQPAATIAELRHPVCGCDD
jgi:hypothetical protein